MNKTKLTMLFTVIGTVTFTIGLWIYSTMEKLSVFEYSIAGLVGIIVIVSLVMGIKQMKDHKKGLPVEDEMSVRVKQKAAAVAFVYSIYMWTFIVLFTVDITVRPIVPVGLGIVGMGVLFVVLWMYYSKVGIEGEDKD